VCCFEKFEAGGGILRSADDSCLLHRTFAIDALTCSRCGGRVRILAAIHPPDNTRKILECLGLPSRRPPVAPARLTPKHPEF